MATVTQIPGVPPFAQAWLQAQQAFLQLARSGLVAQPGAGGTERFTADLYRPLFAIPALPAGLPGAAPTGPWPARYQQAAERLGRLLNDVALDAARRLGAALADESPGAAPITTLRELHALWIECGEAAWAVAAHREDFAATQAEFLASLAALRAAETAP